MANMAIVILSGIEQKDRALAGLHVSQRIFDARIENGIDAIEVFLFNQGIRLLGEHDEQVASVLSKLMANGIVVGACSNQLHQWGLADEAEMLGVQAEFARDAFSRYARDGYTVMTF
ncbi:DsrE family protein [Sulfobacillus thermosulfidooxidans]|uniref:DsrE family protein n=1 Tax=Sulfobacillus thermosulfidooxidans TaxID=28034 RepID=UPI00096BC6A8|nr:DsrE family protein [Sulfobacillus thermosulfidooxidans]OLZ11216.1 hypothetical protein BFX05_08020 [Sulfobacillus thermosulfidooxidans]OLZ13445.1 hypothetical protein BFX06_09745 [Sulfobacillus thermosulfidooxidans]OLZ21692.1 hypothetical protein BFX07_12795 [Sulfobacillus thermosulfidooxidans]